MTAMDTMNGNMVEKERAIRAIVKQSMWAFAAGFGSQRFGKNMDYAGISNLDIENISADTFCKYIQHNTTLSHYFSKGFMETLEYMAVNIASLISDNYTDALYKTRQLLRVEKAKYGCEFWNSVCNSPNGYSIIFDEYKKNAGAIISVLR